MQEFTAPTVYFKTPGAENTHRTLTLAAERARQLKIHTILIATTSGDSAALAVRTFAEEEVIAVTHAAGFKDANTQELTPQNRAVIEAAGAKILTCQHALGGVNRAVRKQLGGIETDEIIANTLRIFEQGMKVIPEIAMMAADAGLVRTGEPVICIAGSSRGADMAAVALPVNTYAFFEIKILETICRPAPGHPLFQ